MENAKSVTKHAQADVQAAKSASNVIQLVALVPDIQLMNVLTVGVELNSIMMDAAHVIVALDMNNLATSARIQDASLKDAMHATRVYVFIVNMVMTLSTDNANNVEKKIVKILICFIFQCVMKRAFDMILDSVTVMYFIE
jgi:hypothetical protein